MPLNQPYDPRYNAKIYVPKLTEEQRRAWATPLENLRGLRYRSETPKAPAPLEAEAEVSPPEPTQVAGASPFPSENAIPESAGQVTTTTSYLNDAVLPVLGQTLDESASDYTPSAREILFAEFPELFPLQYQEVYEEAHLQEESVIFEPCLVGGGPEGTVLHAKARAPQECFPLHKIPTPEPGTPQRAGSSLDFKYAGQSRGDRPPILYTQDGTVATLPYSALANPAPLMLYSGIPLTPRSALK